MRKFIKNSGKSSIIFIIIISHLIAIATTMNDIHFMEGGFVIILFINFIYKTFIVLLFCKNEKHPNPYFIL